MNWFDDENFYGPLQFSAEPKPTFLPLMKRPDGQVQKTNSEKEMRDLLERTRLMLRGG